jgi:hypothetical protein
MQRCRQAGLATGTTASGVSLEGAGRVPY